MAWPLIIAGMLWASPLYDAGQKARCSSASVCTFRSNHLRDSFVGGLIKGAVDLYSEKRKHNDAQKVRVENTGVLLASGMIAGEALMGLLIAIFAVFDIFLYNYFSFFKNPTFFISFVILAIIAYVLIQIPLKNAGKPDQPAPPASGM